MTSPRIYLAGPDVFLWDPRTQAQKKQKLCTAYGFVGVSPVDNALDLSGLSKHQAGMAISAANEDMIRGCQLLIANLTPFRGASADVGTVYEVGFARGIGLPVLAYTNTGGTFLDRTREQLGPGVASRASGELEDAHHMALEDFDLVDNLMLDGAVHASGAEVVVYPTPLAKRFVDLGGFEECLYLAASHFGLSRP